MTRKDTLKRKADGQESAALAENKILKTDASPATATKSTKASAAIAAAAGNAAGQPNWMNMVYPSWNGQPNPDFNTEDEDVPIDIANAAAVASTQNVINPHAHLNASASGIPLPGQGAPRLYWTGDMDNLLREAVGLHGLKKWVAVAQHVGHGTDNNQCLNRWTTRIDPDLSERKRGAWNEEEESALIELVQNNPNMILKELKNNQDCFNWKLIGEQLNRTRQDCKGKWKNIMYSRLKTGPFSPEEDAVILNRVAEWGDKGAGLWVALERDLGRPGRRIRERFKKL